jgi:polyribonucleotide nucleotidyltransferase
MEAYSRMVKKNWDLGGKNFYFETGRMAKQADGAVLVGINSTVVLVTAVAAKDKEVDKDFFPLSVEYREKFYPAASSSARGVPARRRRSARA